MKKPHIAILITGLAILGFTFIVLLINFIHDVKINSNDIYEPTMTIAAYFVIGSPIFVEELTLIRSIYKFIKLNPKGIIRLCYFISIGLILFSLIFQILIFANVITFDSIQGHTNVSFKAILITQWPIIIVSFVLGSIKPKNRFDN